MSRRGRRAAAAVAAVVAFLFLGRWLTAALADVWWGETIAPETAAFLAEVHLARFLLDAAGVVLASVWFGFHLVIVFRAIGAVQVPRHLANVEFREALTARVLLAGALGLALLLGLIVGTAGSELWPAAYLAWHGVSFGLTDPVLGLDLGYYVAQLPLRLALQRSALVLVLLATAGTLTLYVVIGAVRWIERRPAINSHARAHVGWLLATLAVVLAWGWLLHPAAVVAGAAGEIDAGAVRAARLAAPALVGTGLMVALLSALWAFHPRHLLALAAWLVLGMAWLGGRVVVPAALRTPGEPVAGAGALQPLLGHAFGLGALQEASVAEGAALPTAPLTLYDARLAATAAGGGDAAVAARVLRTRGTDARPAWVIVRPAGERTRVVILADDRTTPSGAPLFYRPSDPEPHPAAQPWADLADPIVRAGARPYAVHTGELGVPLGGALRRTALAWALQAPALLRTQAADARVAWRIGPRARAAGAAPWARWGEPEPRLAGERLVWVVPGYVTSATFPLVPRVPFGGDAAGYVRASLLAVIDAERGATTLYLRPGADPVTQAWADIAAGTVLPWERLDPSLLATLPYPPELFAAQAAALDRSGFPVSDGTEHPRLLPDSEPWADQVWAADSSGPVRAAAFAFPDDRDLAAVLLGSVQAGEPRLTLLRVDSGVTVAAPTVLVGRWSRFPLFDQLGDSVRAASGRLESLPVRLWLGAASVGAYRPSFGLSATGRPALAWISVSGPEGLGAGRDELEALQNLSGQSVPAPFTPAGRTPLDEARRWLEMADSALRRGDVAGFGRAWEGLRTVLAPPADTVP